MLNVRKRGTHGEKYALPKSFESRIKYEEILISLESEGKGSIQEIGVDTFSLSIQINSTIFLLIYTNALHYYYRSKQKEVKVSKVVVVTTFNKPLK